MNSTIVLKIPGLWGSTPYYQSIGGTNPSLVEGLLDSLKAHFRNPQVRNMVEVDGVIRACEFHKLERRDAEAGMRMLDYLTKQGYEITRVDVSSSEHGMQVAAVVYILQK